MKPKPRDWIELVYEDLDLIVIEKPSGIITYPVDSHTKNSAIQLIRKVWRKQGRSDSHLYLVHRIDQETSGLLVFAKTTLARKSLQDQFSRHAVLREYLAITNGIPKQIKGEIRTFLGRNFRGKRAVAFAGKQAVTNYLVLRQNRATNRALVQCRLQTGRTHQIRIHLAHLGSPVLGDAVYGKTRSGRLALHAATLGLIHPRTRAPLLLYSSPPQEWRRLV
ncbi:MAG TPA: RluA family pseudouridine synthase [Acidobacteriota bacterium]|nr:RluA family pseudouridine synthase [Acidobacteriota bacterium]